MHLRLTAACVKRIYIFVILFLSWLSSDGNSTGTRFGVDAHRNRLPRSGLKPQEKEGRTVCQQGSASPTPAPPESRGSPRSTERWAPPQGFWLHGSADFASLSSQGTLELPVHGPHFENQCPRSTESRCQRQASISEIGKDQNSTKMFSQWCEEHPNDLTSKTSRDYKMTGLFWLRSTYMSFPMALKVQTRQGDQKLGPYWEHLGMVSLTLVQKGRTVFRYSDALATSLSSHTNITLSSGSGRWFRCSLKSHYVLDTK